ncbi:MAG: hypothetical protein JSW05_08165, partial [Candidatus Thorarchaeota archaeon]
MQEDNPLPPGLFIILLIESVCPYIPVEDVDVHMGFKLFKLQGIPNRLAAAHPRAIRPLIVAATHALN